MNCWSDKFAGAPTVMRDFGGFLAVWGVGSLIWPVSKCKPSLRHCWRSGHSSSSYRQSEKKSNQVRWNHHRDWTVEQLWICAIQVWSDCSAWYALVSINQVSSDEVNGIPNADRLKHKMVFNGHKESVLAGSLSSSFGGKKRKIMKIIDWSSPSDRLLLSEKKNQPSWTTKRNKANTQVMSKDHLNKSLISLNWLRMIGWLSWSSLGD